MQSSIDSDELSEVLQADDHVVLMDDIQVSGCVDILFLQSNGVFSSTPCSVDAASVSVDTVLKSTISRRLVVVSAAGNAEAASLARAIAEAGVTTLCCSVSSGCDAGDFMDDDDSEAVAERLRQLGYI